MDAYSLALEELAISKAVIIACKSDRTAMHYKQEINRRLKHEGADWHVILDNDRRTLRAVSHK